LGEKRLVAFVILLVCVALCVAYPAIAQDDPYSIRVESNQVLVPTIVLNEERTYDSGELTSKEQQCEVANAQTFVKLHPREVYAPADCQDIEIRGLSAQDFQVFEDGVEQKLQSVTFERTQELDVRDNWGDHYETSDTDTGRWSVLDRQLLGSYLPASAVYFYSVAYVPPRSEAVSCHRVKVKVRRKAFVYSRDQYCNVQYSFSDPLDGTKFGNQLAVQAVSAKDGKIALATQTGFVYTDTGIARVDIAIMFPWETLHREWNDWKLSATIGFLGMIYGRDGKLASRISDFGCCPADHLNYHPHQGTREDGAFIPSRYETQVDLPPGNYTFRLLLSDGEKFGLAELPVTIDTFEGKSLTISSVMLCKRFSDAGVAAQEATAANFAARYVPLVSKGVNSRRQGILPSARANRCLPTSRCTNHFLPELQRPTL